MKFLIALTTCGILLGFGMAPTFAQSKGGQTERSRNAESSPAGPSKRDFRSDVTEKPSTSRGNIDELKNFRSTGNAEFETINQKSSKAENLRSNLDRIDVPDGFEIELYAVVPDARHMAVGKNAGVVFVGTRKNSVWAVTDRDKDRVADEVKSFAPSIDFDIPNGVCFTDDGFLFLAEQNRVLAFPAAEFFYESPDVAVQEVVAQGDLIPTKQESFNHSARVCTIGPDGKLYIALGQPFNVPPEGKLDLYAKQGMGGIIRLNRDGSNREVYATGIRNSVGIAFRPGTDELWFTDNQVDGMGDKIPPEELNRSDKQGQNFGFPYFGGGDVRTTEYKDLTPPGDAVAPVRQLTAHAASLGLMFYTGQAFPEKYRNGAFFAQHGSWNRSDPVGARIMFVPFDESGAAGTPEVFAEGWLRDDTDEYIGRPVDVAALPDGSLLISDDFAGALYRISYSDPTVQQSRADK